MKSRKFGLAVVAALGLTTVSSPAFAAALVMGEASLSGQFVPLTAFTDNSSPVQISQSSTIMGTPTGTVLGQVKVNGTDGGFFTLGSFGQKAFDHESKFSFSDTITNSGPSAAAFKMDFLISAGALETIAREIPPRAGSDATLQAGYSISIRAGANTVFQSAATLFMMGDWPSSFNTTSSLVQSGVDLGGVLSHPDLGAPDRWLYQWGDFMGSVDLGVLASGQSVMIEYDARTFVTAGVDKCATSDCAARASIGDPFDVYDTIDNNTQSSIGGEGTISGGPAVVSVVEPGTLALFGLGLAGLGFARRRKAA